MLYFINVPYEELPGSSVVKNLPAMQETRVQSSVPMLGRSPGGGNGNLLQYSCLQNPMDRGAWWATVHGVAKSQTPLRYWAHIHTRRALSQQHLKNVCVISSNHVVILNVLNKPPRSLRTSHPIRRRGFYWMWSVGNNSRLSTHLTYFLGIYFRLSCFEEQVVLLQFQPVLLRMHYPIISTLDHAISSSPFMVLFCLCLRKMSQNIKMHREDVEHCKLCVKGEGKTSLWEASISRRTLLFISLTWMVPSSTWKYWLSLNLWDSVSAFQVLRCWVKEESQLLEETVEIPWFPVHTGAKR